MRFSIFLLDTHTYVTNMIWTSPRANEALWFSESGVDDNALAFPEQTALQLINRIAEATGRPALLHLKL